MGQLTRSAIVLALVFELFGRQVIAQAPEVSRTALVIGAAGAGMLAESESDNILGLGVAVGFEPYVTKATSVRVLSTVLRGGIGAGDNTLICAPLPGGGCRPRDLMPRWLATTELTASVAPVSWIPLRLHGGIGLSVAGDARESWAGAPATDSAVKTPGVLRAGLEIRVGSGPRSPRLILSRAWFAPKPFSLRRLDGLAILFPR